MNWRWKIKKCLGFITLLNLVYATEGMKLKYSVNLEARIKRNAEECGLQNLSDGSALLTGSERADEYEYPWVVAVYNANNDYICAGSIISPRHILSAAHCFADLMGVPRDKGGYTIVAGKYYRDITIKEESEQRRKIETLVIHDDYRGNTHKYRDDICLIEVDKELTISPEVRPVCIDWKSSYETSDFRDGNTGVIAAWGATTEGGDQSTVLSKLNIPYRSRNICWDSFPQQFRLAYFTTDKFCAGYLNNKKSICNGDSGAGLCFKSDGRKYFLKGIASVGVRAETGCNSNQYALYTRISRYLPWLEEIIGNKITKEEKQKEQVQKEQDERKEQTSQKKQGEMKDSGCLLPFHVPNGRYQFVNESIYDNGGFYVANGYTSSDTAISLICYSGYFTTHKEPFICQGNKWVPGLRKASCMARGDTAIT